MDNFIISTLEDEPEAQRGPLWPHVLFSRREAIAGIKGSTEAKKEP